MAIKNRQYAIGYINHRMLICLSQKKASTICPIWLTAWKRVILWQTFAVSNMTEYTRISSPVQLLTRQLESLHYQLILFYLPGSATAFDEINGGAGDGEEQEGEEKCLYIMVDSVDRLQLNVTPQAITVLKDITEVGQRLCFWQY